MSLFRETNKPDEQFYKAYVIGPPAEHNGRRIEHLAPHIASFVAPTKYVRPLTSDDDSLRDSDSEDELYYIDY